MFSQISFKDIRHLTRELNAATELRTDLATPQWSEIPLNLQRIAVRQLQSVSRHSRITR
jgi:hypothetical protein